MANNLSDYAEAALLDHLFSLSAGFAQPTLYLALSTADPTEDGSGLAEPAAGAYARVVTAGTDWSRTANVVENANELSFPQATASWGTLTHAAIYDAATGGNLIAYGPLGTAKAIAANETLRFPAGNITFSLD